MNNRKTSIIWKIDRNSLQRICNESVSKVDVLKKLNLNPYNGNHRTLNLRIEADKIDISLLNSNSKKWRSEFNKRNMSNQTMDDLKIFCVNSKVCQSSIKRRLYKTSYIERKCAVCENTGIWNDKALSLQLNHINGINNDNRIENLEWLCPNCHSQTETYCGRNVKKQHICKKCNNQFSGYGKICKECYRQSHSKKFYITKEELERLIGDKIPFTKIGKMFGVSDNAIRKRCRKLNIVW